MIVLGFDTATPATAVALRLADGTVAERATTRRRARTPGTPRGCWRWPGCSSRPGCAGESSSGSPWVSARGRSRGCASASPPRAGSRSRSTSSWSGVSSLQALAAGAATEREPARPVLAVIDARRGEVFAAAYARSGEAAPRS